MSDEKSLLSINIRLASFPSDASSIIRVHYSAVHNISQNYYSKEILNLWSTPITEKRINKFIKRHDQENNTSITIVAVEGNSDTIVGFAELVPSENTIRACYVDPKYPRKGIGLLLLNELEQIAISHNMCELVLDSALNAEEFYLKAGFQIVEYGIHMLKGEVEMNCVKMKKTINTNK